MSPTLLLDAASSSWTSKLVPASTATTRLAHEARLAVDRRRAVEDLGEDSGGRRLARAAGAAEQVRVADPAVADGVAQRGDDVILPPHVGETARPVAPVQGLVRHARRLYRQVGGGNLSRPRLRTWRSGPVQLRAVNRVRAGRQQLSADPAVCRRSPGRHLRGRGRRFQEGCESGRIGTLGKRVWGNPPWVRIPLPPLHLRSAPRASCLGRLSHGNRGSVDTETRPSTSVTTQPRHSVGQSTMCGSGRCGFGGAHSAARMSTAALHGTAGANRSVDGCDGGRTA